MSRNLKISIIEGLCFSVMFGIGESYLPAFALSLGMSETLAGLFGSLPLVGGAILQLISPWAILKLKSVKKWAVLMALLQALCFLPLMYFALHPTTSYWIVFLIAVAYWSVGFAIGPAWNYWISALVPKEIAHNYFNTRFRLVQIVIMGGIFLGSFLLANNVSFGPLTTAFSVIFLIAFVARLLSAWFLNLTDDVDTAVLRDSQTELLNWRKMLADPELNKFFTFLFFFTICVWMSGPFVNPFLLEELKYSYSDYKWIIAALIVGKVIGTLVIPRVQKKIGTMATFLVGCFGVSPWPALWAISGSLYFSVALQFISGFFWAFIEVGLALIFFEKLSPAQKIAYLTVFNFFNALAIVIGSLLGAALLSSLGEDRMSYAFLFILAAFCRLAFVGFYYLRGYRRDLRVPKARVGLES